MTPQPTDLDHTPIRDADAVAAIADRAGLQPRGSLRPPQSWTGPGYVIRLRTSPQLVVHVLVHADHDHGRDAWDVALHYETPAWALQQLLAGIAAARNDAPQVTR